MSSSPSTARAASTSARRYRSTRSSTRMSSQRLLDPSSGLSESSDEVDGHGNCDGAEAVGEQGVTKRGLSNRAVRGLGVGGGVGHPDGEGKVGEVAVCRGLLLFEVDSACAVDVVA